MNTNVNGIKSRERVRAYLKSCTIPPTIREIGNACGLKSTSTVHSHLRHLETQGVIVRLRNSPRSIVMTDIEPTDANFTTPTIGSVARMYEQERTRAEALGFALKTLLEALKHEPIEKLWTAKAMNHAEKALAL